MSSEIDVELNPERLKKPRSSMSESEVKIEWLFISLRWFFLLAVAGVTAIDVMVNDAEFTVPVIILLIIGGIANIMGMVAMLQNAMGRTVQIMMLVQDIGLALGFIGGSGGTDSPLLFACLIPIATATLRFSRLYGLLIVVGIVAGYGIISWNKAELSLAIPIGDLAIEAFPFLANGIVLLVAGSAINRIGVRIKQALEAEREKQEKEAETALEAAHQKVRLVFELASTLSATLNYERVLEAALDVSNAGLREFFTDNKEITQIGIILLFGMDRTLYIAKSRGVSTNDDRLRFPAQDGVLAVAIETPDPIIVNEPREDPELGQIAAMQTCRQAIIVPVRAGFESFGLLVLGSPEPYTYTTDFQDLLVAICNQAVMALQNANLYQNLMEEKDRLVTVEEDARKKLARNLHDGPTQTIAAIAMRLNYIRMLVTRDTSKSAEELRQLEELARKTTKEIRQMLFTLRPLILETQGIIAALQQLKKKRAETDPVPTIHLELNKPAEKMLSKAAQGAIFYITEEAATNVRKHASAENLWIRLYQHGMNAVVEIEDDGVGFNVAELEENYDTRGSLGMLNIRERAKLVNGRSVIKSTPGQGTKISITIPVEVPEAEMEP